MKQTYFYIVVSLIIFFSMPHSYTQSSYLQISPETYHLGTIPDSQVVTSEFEIINQHPSKTLEISNIKTFCSCTVVGESEMEVSPQSKKKFRVEFNPRGRQNYLRWEVQLIHNFSSEPLKAVFDVTVLRDHYLSHNSIFLDEFRQGKQFTKNIYISPIEYPEFQISKMQWQGNPSITHFNIRYQKEMYEGFYPKERMAYCIQVSPKATIPYGGIQGKIIIHTNWDKHPIIEVDVLGKVSSDIATNRTYISFGVLRDNSIRRDALVYAVDEKQSFKITKVQCDIPFIQNTVETIFEQRYYQINLLATPTSNVPAGEFRGTLKIYTDNPNQQEVCIPIQGVVLPR